MGDLAADDPQWIGGYRLLSRLGSGGMGRVYLARSEGGRTVAVKLVKTELASQELFRARFRQEVEAARRVGARWTAPVLDADTEADTPWVATGYIAGPSLDEVVSGSVRGGHGPLPERSVRTLAYGLASALLDIHGAGLIHRDLKPSNVLLTIDGPRVIDFGIARALYALPESSMTSTGVTVGSPTFMSPEQIKSQHLTPASDVFCMGTLLAYAATGRPPFGGGGPGGVHSVMFRIATEDPDLEGITEPLLSLIKDCMAKDPEKRPAPEDVVARVQPISTGTASAPWLPATLIAELGRHAVQLLDTDTPPSGSRDTARTGAGQGQGAEASATPPPGAGSGAGSGSGAPSAELAARHGALASASYGAETGLVGTGARSGGAGGAETGSARGGRSRRRRLLLALGAVVLVACAGVVASGADVPLLGSVSGADDASGSGASDVPADFVGTWSGPVDRYGEPTGQYRRFVISKGGMGEIVADSISLGKTYECKSDGKLDETKTNSKGETSIELDTKVVKSVPDGRCSALGSHTLIHNSDGTLTWKAAGRSAKLRKVTGAEKIPDAYIGTWQRPLANGGTQRMTVERKPVGSAAVTLVSEGGGEHCEASVDLFSAGGTDEPLRVAPPLVNQKRSSGDCATGDASELRVTGDGHLVREFPGGYTSLTYTRVN
ncbi:serine/threonine-protein kinase [Streptomyces sp. NPDC054796]